MNRLIAEVREKIINEHPDAFLDIDNIKRRPEQERIIKETLKEMGEDDPKIISEVISTLIGFNKIEPLLNDKLINEIMINGQEVWIEKEGKIFKTEISFDTIDEVEVLLQRIVQLSGRRIDWSTPLVDARLPDGSRVHAVIKPSAEYPVITIRKFVEHYFTFEELIQQGYMNEEMAVFFDTIVKGKLNILLCGSAGSSKTTFLRTLATKIPADERLIVIEDIRELNIPLPHVISLEATEKVTVHDLMKNALRMRPDRIILGECRGMETFELLQAMGTGHNGSITTVHANNAKKDVVQRLVRAMIPSGMSTEELITQIISVLDITVYMKKFKDGWRIINVCEVINDNGKPAFKDIFVYDFAKKQHKNVNSLSNETLEKIRIELETNTLPNIVAFKGM